MTIPTQLSSAAGRLESDCRMVCGDFTSLYGASSEATKTWPASTKVATVKKEHVEWLAEVEGRIATLRAALRGEGIDLTHRDAMALAGHWYTWFVAKHEDAPGNPERWDTEQWQFIDALKGQLPADLLEQQQEHPSHELDEWTRDPEVRAGMRPFIADHGHTAQFLALQGRVVELMVIKGTVASQRLSGNSRSPWRRFGGLTATWVAGRLLNDFRNSKALQSAPLACSGHPPYLRHTAAPNMSAFGGTADVALTFRHVRF